MMTDRRKFLSHTIAAGSLSTILVFDPDDLFAQQDCTLPNPPKPQPFVPAEPKVVNRISALEMSSPANAASLARLRRGFAAVQALPPADVIGWQKWIAQHCINCAPSDQSNIHFDWQFLPWHRALLYFLERTLRKLATGTGADDLRLVYWDWENPSSRVLPAIYAPAGQSLFYANRGNLSGPKWPLPDRKVNVQSLLAIPQFAQFGGTATQSQPTPSVFSGPHADVHNNFNPGDMADLQYSPRDPVFYAHHSNIDRLWSSWVAAGHTNPDFGQGKVYFYDETRTWRSILMNQLKDETKLGYKYSSLMQPAKSGQKLRTISMKANNRNVFAMASAEVADLKAKASEPVFLHLTNIRDLEKLPDDTLDYGIFAGKPAPGSTPGPENGYIGSANRVFSSGHNHVGPLSAALTATGKVAALFPGNSTTVDLRVVPIGDDNKTKGTGIPLRCDSVSVVR